SATNLNDDVAGFVVTPTSGLVTTEAGGTAAFTVRLTSQPTAPVTINLTSGNPAEGKLSVSSLTFTSANRNVPQTVTVTGVHDFTLRERPGRGEIGRGVADVYVGQLERAADGHRHRRGRPGGRRRPAVRGGPVGGGQRRREVQRPRPGRRVGHERQRRLRRVC